jgi:isopentenyl-diphosphate Delta-isomerase
MTEMLYVVDKEDNVLRSESRKIVHASSLWHRGVHIILKNSNGEILMQLRSPDKDKFPNRYDISVSEHVTFGESYDEAARRGLFEELGIEAPLTETAYFRMPYGPSDFMINKLYTIEYDGQFQINGEVIRLSFFDKKRLLNIIDNQEGMLTPWGNELLNHYFGRPNKLIRLK